jgi:periplasmic protein TonB
MPFEPRNVSEENQDAGLGSLRGCLVEGDAEQQHRERRVRRRALVVSIALQSAFLAVLVLVPLLGKTERLALAYATPVPPYSRYRSVSHDAIPNHPPRGGQTACRICAPSFIPPTIATHDSQRDGTDESPTDSLIGSIPGAPDGLIPISDARANVRPPEPDRRPAGPRIVHVTRVDPAMLIYRVEPIYPLLAKQTHREGRVELRAIIATNGTIQSVQVVSGDVLFVRSALEAVQQWRYKPTILNGQPVEIDTYITVIYTMQH